MGYSTVTPSTRAEKDLAAACAGVGPKCHGQAFLLGTPPFLAHNNIKVTVQWLAVTVVQMKEHNHLIRLLIKN